MPSERLAPVAFVAICLLWGSTFLAIAFTHDTSLAPVWSAAIRLALAAVLLAAIAFGTRQPFPRGRALGTAAGFGVFQFGINFSLLYWAEASVPSGIAAVFYATAPLMVALFAWPLGIERPDGPRLAAALAGLAGVALVVGGESLGDVPVVALLAVFLAAASASFSGVVPRLGPRQAVVPMNAVASAVAAPICLAASALLGESWRAPSGAAEWGPLLYLTLAGSLGAVLLFSWLVQVWPPSVAGTVGLVIPVVALVLGAVVRGERPHPLALVGAAVVLASVAFALTRAAMQARRPPPAPPQTA